MRIVNCSFFIFIILPILGCSKYDEAYFEAKLQRFVESNQSTYSFSGKEIWEINQIFEGARQNSFDFSFEGRDQDTIKFLSLYVFKETDEVFIDSYIKSYLIGDVKVELLMKIDTFYCFQERDGVKEFIAGEYNYRFFNFDLSPGELNFYMVHKDSLGRIKGNELPTLPYLSDELTDSLLKVKK